MGHNGFLFVTLWSLLTVLCNALHPGLVFSPSGRRDGSIELVFKKELLYRVELVTPFYFDGEKIPTIWISKNGFITLQSPDDIYDLQDYPITGVNETSPLLFESIRAKMIAPFISKNENNQSGVVRVLELSPMGTLNCLQSRHKDRIVTTIQNLFPKSSKIEKPALLTINWDDMDNKNSVEMIILTASRQSYVIFHYNNISSISDTEAPQAGVNVGDGGEAFLLPRSGDYGSPKQWNDETNVNVEGEWIIKIGEAGKKSCCHNPTISTEAGRETGEAARRFIRESVSACRTGPTQLRPVQGITGPTCPEVACDVNAACVNVFNRKCCVCSKNFFGNGTWCKSWNEDFGVEYKGPMEMSFGDRKVRESFMVTATYDKLQDSVTSYGSLLDYTTARTFSNRLLMNLPLFYITNALFAKPGPGAVNLFSITSGTFDMEVRVTFPDYGTTTIQVKAFGVDQHGRGNWVVTVTSDSPKLSEIFYEYTSKNRYEVSYQVLTGGILMFPEHILKMTDGGDSEIVGKWSGSLTFKQTCQTHSYAGKKYYVKLTEGKYCMTDCSENNCRPFCLGIAYVFSKEPTPCDGTVCESKNSHCVIVEDSYDCVCNTGFTRQSDGSCAGTSTPDVCATCDYNAECIPLAGSMICQCKPGYKGTGQVCSLDVPLSPCDCNMLNRPELGQCINNQCECRPGLKRVSFELCAECIPSVGCGANALCEFTANPPHMFCKCSDGYVGDGFTCTGKETPIGCETCDRNAECVRMGSVFGCKCRAGFEGNGQLCTDLVCRTCHPEADCVMENSGFRCQCRAGFEGTGQECRAKGGQFCNCNTLYKPETWQCVAGKCVCKPGLQKLTGAPVCLQCNEQDICHANAECLRHPGDGYSYCACKNGHVGDGINCTPSGEDTSLCPQPCSATRECRNGQCLCKPNFLDIGSDQCIYDCETCDKPSSFCTPFGCECSPGYKRDGQKCIQVRGCQVDGECLTNERCIAQMCVCPYQIINKECRPMNPSDIVVTVAPTGDRTVNEGDMVELRCHVASPDPSIVGVWEWQNQPGPIHFAQIVDEPPSIKKLVIKEARPEFGGLFTCRASTKTDSVLLIVKRSGCPRKCHPRAFCDTLINKCTCRDGYVGDGESYCRENCEINPQICPQNAECTNNECRCRMGFRMEGDSCIPEEDCRLRHECDPNAMCINEGGSYFCKCNIGFVGNGRRCLVDPNDCNLKQNCVANAICDGVLTLNRFICICKPGYVGNGYELCNRLINCDLEPEPCGTNSLCWVQTYTDQRSNRTLSSGVCRCQTGYTLVDERCYDNADLQTFFYAAIEDAIIRVPLVSSKKEATSNIYHIENTGGSRNLAVATDCQRRRIFWSGQQGKNIWMGLEGVPGTIRKLPGTFLLVESLAVDWVSGNVYYVDIVSQMIGVFNPDTNSSRVIIVLRERPRAIALDPAEGRLYYSLGDFNNPRIEMANMDGTDQKVLVSTVRSPIGLTYDQASGRLCWTSVKPLAVRNFRLTGQGKDFGQIECVRPADPTKRIQRVADLKDVPPSLGLAMHRNTFYWTVESKREIRSFANQQESKIPIDPPCCGPYAYGMDMMLPQCMKGVTNPCSAANLYGGCRHLCLPMAKGGRVCTCPTGQDFCVKENAKQVQIKLSDSPAKP